MQILHACAKFAVKLYLKMPTFKDLNKGFDMLKKSIFIILFLIVDAGRADVSYDMIRNGELPNIKEHIYDRGTHVENALVAFPTLTLALHPTIMTGYYPGHHGIISGLIEKPGKKACFKNFSSFHCFPPLIWNFLSSQRILPC
jgi:predicted AlkP superfamily pyrophosphatase or phosphodiesterase